MEKRIFSITELAIEAELSTTEVEEWIQEHDVPVHVAAGRRLVDLGELEDDVIDDLFGEDDPECDDEDESDEDAA